MTTELEVSGTETPAAAKYSEDITRVLKDYQESAKQTSDLVRYIGFGLIGIFFAMANSAASPVQRIAANNELLLIVVGLFGCLVVAFDYLNISCRTQAQSNLLDLIDRDDPKLHRSQDGKHYLFDPNDAYYRIARISFYIKQAFAVLGCLCLIFVFGREILGMYW